MGTEIHTPPLRITHSDRAKRLRIRIFSTHIEAVAPKKMGTPEIIGFISDKQSIINNKFTKMKSKASTSGLSIPNALTDGVSIQLLGKSFTVKFDTETKKAHYDGENLMIPSVPDIPSIEQQSFYKAKLETLLKSMFKEYALALFDQYQNTLGVATRLTLRTQKSRWGSCTVDNKIALNWWLIFTDEAVAEYVIVHELCHITHKNHGTHFWALVESTLPHYKPHQKWLTDYGQILQEQATELFKD